MDSLTAKIGLHLVILLGLSAIIASPAGALVSVEEFESAANRLRYRPSVLAKERIRNYVLYSSSVQVQEGLAMLLQPNIKRARLQMKRAKRRLRVDSKLNDWRRLGLPLIADSQNDMLPIAAGSNPGPYRRSDDIRTAGVFVSDRDIYFVIRLFSKPKEEARFYYALNLFTPDARLLYTVSWAPEGFFIQEFKPATGERVRWRWAGAGTVQGRGRVFEGKIALGQFPKLPRHFWVEALSWSEARNAYDSLFFQNSQSRAEERCYNYALELFVRYAERTELEANNPIAVAQAVTDAYLYRMGDSEVRELAVEDGIRSMGQLVEIENSALFGTPPIRELDLAQILVWTNRSLYYAVNSSKWKLRSSLNASGGVFTKELYEHLFLRPHVLEQARTIIERNDLLVANDLPASLRKIEAYLQTIWKYRATLDFIERLYKWDPVSFAGLYQDILYEEQNGLTNIAAVGLDSIKKYWNQSAGFQTAYILEHDFYYGNCGDTSVIAWAMGKALGVPTIHQHYNVTADGGYLQGVHSFPAYYSHQQNRYLGFSAGNNRVFDFALSGNGTDRVAYYTEAPIVTSLWELYGQPYLNSWWHQPLNACGQIVSLDGWQEINEKGVPAESIAECIRNQLF